MRRLLHLFLPALILVSGCTFPGEFGDFSFAPDDGSDGGNSNGKDGGGGEKDGGDEPDEDAGKDAGPKDGGDDEDANTDDMLCMLANCDAVASCDESTGVPICSCPASGYFDVNGDGTKCADLNECKAATHDCEQDSTCKNVPGGFECNCKVGYIYSRTDDKCLDDCIVLLSTVCADEALCTKPQGAGVCRCPFGYMDVSVAKDGSDCEIDTRCQGLNCDPLALCVDAPGGGFACECPDGYSGNGTTCMDIDECANDADNDCDVNATCRNTAGGFTCECKLGFSGDGKTCADEDECALNEDDCSRDAVCMNTAGSFACACKDGFSGDGKTCTDKDECALGTATCATTANCTNNSGGFSCACKSGYSGDGFECQDIDECATGQANCSGAQCTNTPGSYACGDCPSGYQKNPQGVCVDIDECALMPCSVNATCANSEGSYACTCKGGYSGDGTRCVDVDECANDTDMCNANATCTNAPGTYSCACNSGYEGNGSVCTDIDECATGKHTCNTTRGKCTNTTGSYTCACNTGYSGDGRTCDDVNECSSGTDDCDNNPDACKNTVGSFICECPTGNTGTGKGQSGCLRNECTDGTENCDNQPLATCTDAVDGYTCACPLGYPQAPSTGVIGQNACCTPDGNTDATHPNDGKDNECDGLTDAPVLGPTAYPEAGAASSGADVTLAALTSPVSGAVLQCRTYKRSATVLPLFAACTTGKPFTAVQSADKTVNGAYRSELRWAYAGAAAFSHVRTHDYYVHSSLHNAEKCSLTVNDGTKLVPLTDAEIFALADTKLNATLVGRGFTDPGAFSTATTFLASPFITLGFKPVTDTYFTLRGLDIFKNANTESPISVNSLRHRFVVSANGRYILMRRTYASRIDVNFVGTNGGKSQNRCKAAEFDYSDSQGQRFQPHITEHCDAVVLNRAGAGVCVVIGPTGTAPRTGPTLPFKHHWSGANQFGYSDSAKFMYRQLLTERRRIAAPGSHFTVFSPKCDTDSSCESGARIFLPDRAVLRP